MGGAVIDDVALARRFKRFGTSVWLGLAGEVRNVRPWNERAGRSTAGRARWVLTGPGPGRRTGA